MNIKNIVFGLVILSTQTAHMADYRLALEGRPLYTIVKAGIDATCLFCPDTKTVFRTTANGRNLTVACPHCKKTMHGSCLSHQERNEAENEFDERQVARPCCSKVSGSVCVVNAKQFQNFLNDLGRIGSNPARR